MFPAIKTNDKRFYSEAFWKIYPKLLNDKRFLIVYGSAGSSKSYSIYQSILLIFSKEAKYDFIVFRKVGATLHNSVYSGFQSIVSNYWKVFNKFLQFKKNPLEIVNQYNVRRIIFNGLDDPEKLKSIVNIRVAVLEEATEFSQADFMEINRRLRGMENIKIILIFNPVSHRHWIKKYFFDNEIVKKDTDFVHCTYHDNRFLTAQDRQQLENLKYIDENDYRVYCLGEWGILTERLIFKNWKVVDEIPANAKRLPSGMDFGFNPDPTALVDVYISGKDIYFDERIYQRNLVNIDLGTGFSVIEKLNDIGFEKEQLIIADSAEPKSIMEIRLSGYNILAVRKPSIYESIKLMKSYKIHITKRSENIINEFENYVHRIDKEGNLLPEPIDDFNHAIDCCRYVLSQKERVW